MTTFTDVGRRPSPRPRPQSDGGAGDAGPADTGTAGAGSVARVSDAATERYAALFTELPDEFARDRADALPEPSPWTASGPLGAAWDDRGSRDDDVSILPGLTSDLASGPLSGPLTGAAPAARTGAGATRSSRRALSALGVLCALSVGFLGGVVVQTHVAATPGTDGRALGGRIEASGDGVLSVRGDDGRLTALRTTPGTRVVRTNPVVGTLPPGTTVEVESRRDADGALTATEIQVGGDAAP